MPIYDYKCKNGHTFEHMRKLIEKDDPIACPDCGKPADQTIIATPMLDPRLGASKDFPSMARKWDKKQRLRSTGQMKDSNQTRYGTNVDVERDAYNLRKRYEQ